MGEREKWSNSIAFWSIATTQLSIRSGLSTAAHDLLIIASQDTGHHESKSLQLIMGNDLNFSRFFFPFFLNSESFILNRMNTTQLAQDGHLIATLGNAFGIIGSILVSN